MTIPYANLPDPDRQAGFYAGVPFKRLVAFIVDLLVILIAAVLVSLLSLGLFFFVFLFVVTVVGFLYRVTTLANRSATWGMRLTGIELRRHDGEAFSFGDAVLHTAGFYLSVALAPVQFLSIILMLTTPRGQSLTDFFFGTVALNRMARA
ncbi:MAG: RDD family protein [Pseudomonadota bacterium]